VECQSCRSRSKKGREDVPIEGDLDLLVAHDPAGGGSGIKVAGEVGAKVKEDPVQP
jgi:hypothetical protein